MTRGDGAASGVHAQRPMPKRAAAVLLAAALAGFIGCLDRPPLQPLPPTTVPPDPEAAASRFVLEFMEQRAAGDEAGARTYLSPTAAEQFAAGAGGLTLTGGGGGFADWALLSLLQADPSSFEARVRVEETGGEAWEELLFVGVGPGPDGEPRDLTVRGAERRQAPPSP